MRAFSSRPGASGLLLKAWCGVVFAACALPAFAQMPAGPVPEAAVTQLISLDLKGVDIIDVLKLLSQKSGLNFVAGHNVAGRVTIFAKDVNIWEAFELITAANGLAYDRAGSLITVMTTGDYERLHGEKFQEQKATRVLVLKYAKSSQVAMVLNQLKSPLGQVVVEEATNTVIVSDVPTRLQQMDELLAALDRPTETRIYRLNYTEVDKLKDKLQEFLTPGVGIVSFDTRTNTVIVNDLAESVARMDEMIRALDEQTREVHIQARILQVTLTDEFSLGIDWQAVFTGLDTTARSRLNVLDGSAIFGGTATGTAIQIASLAENDVQVLIDLLKKYGRTETLSNPRLTAASGSEAKILVGTKEAFVTTTTTVPGSGGQVVSSPQVQFVDVGVKLFVTPAVKADGFVSLKIRPEISRVKTTVTDIANTRIPIVETTESETTVLVQNGMTLIIAGLIKEDSSKTHTQLPWLGDLPLIGAAFRSTAERKERNEIVVFLTPQIITAGGQSLMNFPAAPVVTTIGVDGDAGATPPVPPAYQQQIRGLLEQHLRDHLRLAAGAPGSFEVSFVLSHNGQLIGEPQVAGSQDPQILERVNAAVKSVGLFAPFPKTSRAEYVRFRMEVAFSKGTIE